MHLACDFILGRDTVLIHYMSSVGVDVKYIVNEDLYDTLYDPLGCLIFVC